jgi:PfaD family protein
MDYISYKFSKFSHHPIGWCAENISYIEQEQDLREALYHIYDPLHILHQQGALLFSKDHVSLVAEPSATALMGTIPPCPLENMGNQDFCGDHHIRYAYVSGSMANGIASAEIVETLGRNGMLGFFGAAGLSLEKVEQAIARLSSSLRGKPYGFNLIHSPSEPELESAVVDLYLRRHVQLLEASAYLGLTLPLVRYRVHGIQRNEQGQIITPNRVIAKVSRVEVAAQFFAPPPEKFLNELVNRKEITAEQAQLARSIPVAQDLTAEADSGGHTDNRPAIVITPLMLSLRDQMQRQYGYAQPLRVGAAGGIATPASAAAAFSMGADYILTGSVNQSCCESGTSDLVRDMLAQAEQADMAMAPAADMFELGVKVQVLKRGTMFAMRAARLYDLYRAYNSIEEIPRAELTKIEKQFFKASHQEIWEQTKKYFATRDSFQIEQAEKDHKHKMALIFRWYLGLSSSWATCGDESRKIDYQIWCGPAMGAFNQWSKGSFLASPANRHVDTIAFNLLFGAAVILRMNCLRYYGIQVPSSLYAFSPLDRNKIENYLHKDDKL